MIGAIFRFFRRLSYTTPGFTLSPIFDDASFERVSGDPCLYALILNATPSHIIDGIWVHNVIQCPGTSKLARFVHVVCLCAHSEPVQLQFPLRGANWGALALGRPRLLIILFRYQCGSDHRMRHGNMNYDMWRWRKICRMAGTASAGFDAMAGSASLDVIGNHW